MSMSVCLFLSFFFLQFPFNRMFVYNDIKVVCWLAFEVFFNYFISIIIIMNIISDIMGILLINVRLIFSLLKLEKKIVCVCVRSPAVPFFFCCGGKLDFFFDYFLLPLFFLGLELITFFSLLLLFSIAYGCQILIFFLWSCL